MDGQYLFPNVLGRTVFLRCLTLHADNAHGSECSHCVSYHVKIIFYVLSKSIVSQPQVPFRRDYFLCVVFFGREDVTSVFFWHSLIVEFDKFLDI